MIRQLAMGELHRAGRYDRRADGVQRVTGRPAMSVREFVSLKRGGVRRTPLLKGTTNEKAANAVSGGGLGIYRLVLQDSIL